MCGGDTLYLKVTGALVIENNWGLLIARVVLPKEKKDQLVEARIYAPAPLVCATTFESLGEGNAVTRTILSMVLEGSQEMPRTSHPSRILVTIWSLLPSRVLAFGFRWLVVRWFLSVGVFGLWHLVQSLCFLF